MRGPDLVIEGPSKYAKKNTFQILSIYEKQCSNYVYHLGVFAPNLMYSETLRVPKVIEAAGTILF